MRSFRAVARSRYLLLLRYLLLVPICFCLVPVASAGVKEFNEAVIQADFAAASQETESVWESFDKSNPAAATIAREFAYVNFMAGELERAKSFVSYLLPGDNQLEVEDDQPLVTQLLSSAINYGLDTSDENRAKLVNSIESRMHKQGTDVISIVSAEFLSQCDATQGNWEGLAQSAAQVAELIKRTGMQSGERLRRAETSVAIAAFRIDKSNVRNYGRLVETYNAIVGELDQIENLDPLASLVPAGPPPGAQSRFPGPPGRGGNEEAAPPMPTGPAEGKVTSGLYALAWQLRGWIRNAESLYTTYSRKLENSPTGFQPLKLRSSEQSYFFEKSNEDAALPMCEYIVDTRRVFSFPTSDQYAGDIATVILKANVDEDGGLSEAWALVAVPDPSFQFGMTMSANNIRLRRVKGQDSDSCSLERKDALIPISFEIEGVDRSIR
jgi:hypothetical protein